MKIIEHNKWIVEYDDHLTRKIYKSLTGGPEDCICGNCKNFLLARENFYPDDFKKVLNQLGIDSKKETEIFQSYRVKPGWHLYQGWFHFVGNILKSPQVDHNTIYEQVPFYKGWFRFIGNILKGPQVDLKSSQADFESIYYQVPEFKNFGWTFSTNKDLISDAFEQNPVVQLEWIGLVPWVIDSPEPS